jgi:uncharacterized membrane protein
MRLSEFVSIFEALKLSKPNSVKAGFLDLATALFVIGGVIGLVTSLLTIPISNLYPFELGDSFGFAYVVVLVVGVVCSLGAIHCYSLATKRQLVPAGTRGIIFGAILLAITLGLVGRIRELNSQLGVGSAILILIAGVICFILRE